jgi:hypothetical protein
MFLLPDVVVTARFCEDDVLSFCSWQFQGREASTIHAKSGTVWSQTSLTPCSQILLGMLLYSQGNEVVPFFASTLTSRNSLHHLSDFDHCTSVIVQS